MTFKQCAERYMAAHEVGWKNDTHRDQWHSTLEAYAYPIIGDRPVAAIDTAAVMEVLEQLVNVAGQASLLWTAHPETASRVRGRIEAILRWAKARGFRTGENPARWKEHLKDLLAPRSRLSAVEHHPALPFA